MPAPVPAHPVPGAIPHARRRRARAGLPAFFAFVAVFAGAVAFSVAAQAATSVGSLSLDPSEGLPGAPFTVTYHLTRDRCVEFAQFMWDGALVGTARIDPSSCSAAIRLSPPATAGLTRHAVTAEACFGKADSSDCIPDTATGAGTTYTILGAVATPTPTPAQGTPTPTPAQGTPTPAPSPTYCIAIRKTDANSGAALPGAGFTVFGATGQVAAPKQLTNADGYTQFCRLAGATYTVAETTTPAGYDTAAPRTVKLPFDSATGDALLNVPDAPTEATPTPPPPTPTPATTHCIAIRKTDATSGGALAGAGFTVFHASAALPEQLTNSDGNASFCGLAAGIYTVAETSTPAGYDTAASQTVNLPVDNRTGDAVLSFTDTRTQAPPPPSTFSIAVQLTDAGTKLPLAGAGFTVFQGANGQTPQQVVAQPLAVQPLSAMPATGQQLTDANGSAIFAGLPAGTYTVEETFTPSGYDTVAPRIVTLPVPGAGNASLSFAGTPTAKPTRVPPAPATPTPPPATPTPPPATPTPAPAGPTPSPNRPAGSSDGASPASGATPSPSGSGSAGASGSLSPTASGSSTSNEGSSSSPSASGSGGVLGTTGSPGPSVPPAGPSTAPAGEPVAGGGATQPQEANLSRFIAGIPNVTVIDGKVIFTNLVLTLLFVLLFGLTAEVFNSTMDENRPEIEGWISRLMAGPLAFLRPIGRLDAQLDRLTEQGRLGTFIHAVIVLVLTGVVYGFLSPEFGLNATSVGLFAALVVALGLLTYVDEGTTTFLARRRRRVPSAVRLYGTAVAVAGVCVLISRFLDFEPGFMYGFVASAVILSPVALRRDERAQLVVVPSLIVLAISVAAWMLLTPVRAALDADGGWLLTLLESVLATVFVAGLEGLFFGLVPLHFLDGAVVMRWSRIGWALLFGSVTFLWWQLILNRSGEYADAFQTTDARVVVTALLAFMVTTGSIWVFFRLRERSEEAEEPLRGGEA